MSLRDPYARAVIRDFPEAYLRLNESLSASAAVLADGPLAYWRLNDAEGYQQAVLSDGARGFWRLNGNATDESGFGSPAGVVTGVVNFGQGGPLSNGTTAARFMANGYGNTDTGGTITVAFTPPATTTRWTFELWLKRKGPPTNTSGYQRLALSVMALQLEVKAGASVLDLVESNVGLRLTGKTNVVDNQWHHVAITCDGTATRLYVDGQLDGTYAGTIAITGTSLRIGGYFGGGYVWDGYLSHVAYWNVPLTLGQIQNHVGLKSSTIATMTPTVIADAVGTYPGTKFGGVTLQQAGALADGSTGALFDGATGYVNTAASGITAQANSFSAEAWVNHQGLPWNPTYFSMVWVAGSGTYLAVHTSGQVMMSTYAGGVQVFTLGGTVVPTSGWHHIAATWDGNGDRKVRMFLDGVLTATGAALPVGPLEGGYWKLGMFDANHRMNGAIDEVAVYANVLTPGQVQHHYALRTSVVVGGTGLPALADATGHGHTGTLFGASALGEVSALGDGTTALRLFSNGADATDSGGYATAPIPVLGAKWTCEFLLRKDMSNYGIGAACIALSVNPLQIRINQNEVVLRVLDGVAAQFRIVGTKNVRDNKWHHVIVTSDGKTLKMYIDGVQDGPTYAGTITVTDTVLNLGRYNGGGYTWDGWLDEVAVYLDDRNQAEVTRHYRGIPLVIGDHVLESARAGIARSGNTRSDSYTPFPEILIGGVSRFANLEKDTLRLTYLLNAQTDTCSFSLFGTRPSVGQEVYITAGGPTKLVFGGTIQRATQRSVRKNLREFWDVDCTDWQWTLNDRRVFEHFPAGMLVSAMAVQIVTTYCPGFSTSRIQGSVASAGDVVFQGTPAGDALQQLADLLGWHCLPEPDKTIVFKPKPTVFDTAPAPLTSLNFVYDKLTVDQDISQIMTRVHGVGGGGQTTAPVAVGGTIIPVNEVGWYATSGTVMHQGVPITYTGRTAVTGTTGPGSLIGVSGVRMPMLQGDTVAVYDVVNDLAAQSALARLRGWNGVGAVPSSGIREGMVSDGRWSLASTHANALSKLNEFKSMDIRGRYTTRDKLTDVGRTITLDIAARGLAAADFSARGLSNTVEIQKVSRQFLQSEGGGASRTWVFSVEFATTWSDLVDLLATVTATAEGD